MDLTVSGDSAGPPRVFSDACEIRHVAHENLDQDQEVHGPIDSICLDYDYPDIPGLSFLTETKKLYPSIPVIMLTVQHSEDLAVWAFRARVWDYLVKPVSTRDVGRCLDGLMRVLVNRDKQHNRAIEMPGPPLPREARFRPPGSTSQVAPALAYISANFSRPVREPDLASMCDLSPYRFSRVFKEEVGITFQEYLVRFRLEEACRLMANPSASVTDVAYTVGFNSPSYFSRAFRQVFDASPSEYRKKIDDAQVPEAEVVRHVEGFDEGRFLRGAVVNEVSESDPEGRYLRTTLVPPSFE